MTVAGVWVAGLSVTAAFGVMATMLGVLVYTGERYNPQRSTRQVLLGGIALVLTCWAWPLIALAAVVVAGMWIERLARAEAMELAGDVRGWLEKQGKKQDG